MSKGVDIEVADTELDGKWLTVTIEEETSCHVVPANDLIVHTINDECVCGPTQEPVKCKDGSIGYVVTHHSLDGRERHERSP